MKSFREEGGKKRSGGIMGSSSHKKNASSGGTRVPILCLFNLQITVTVNSCFVDYIREDPIVFEVFGHYHQHPLHKDSRQEAHL